jgi:hypothetical protein
MATTGKSKYGLMVELAKELGHPKGVHLAVSEVDGTPPNNWNAEATTMAMKPLGPKRQKAFDAAKSAVKRRHHLD